MSEKKTTVTGIAHIIQSVEISSEELLESLWKICGLERVRQSEKHSGGEWFKRVGTRLIGMRNISYHGSPQYEPNGFEIDDPIKVRQYDLLKELEKTLENDS